MICLEHKLSVIRQPQHTGKTYDKWLRDKAIPTHRDILHADIDRVLEQGPKNMDALLDGLKTMGYEIKHGKQLSFRKAGQKRFIRMDTLGDAYSYDALSAVLAGSQKHRPKTKPIQQNELISKAIDAQRMEAKGKGYTYWAKNFNSKQYAKSILFLTENHLSIDDLPRAVEEACTKADALTAELKKVEAKSLPLRSLSTRFGSICRLFLPIKSTRLPAGRDLSSRNTNPKSGNTSKRSSHSTKLATKPFPSSRHFTIRLVSSKSSVGN